MPKQGKQHQRHDPRGGGRDGLGRPPHGHEDRDGGSALRGRGHPFRRRKEHRDEATGDPADQPYELISFQEVSRAQSADTPAKLVEDHGRDDHQAGDEALHGFLGTGLGEAAPQYCDQHDADTGTNDRSPAARQTRAAYHHGRDGP